MAPLRDRLGIFLSGGNARGRPYDEDYDLIALVDSSVPEERRAAERVAALMNRQIARRGVIPQHRLGEHLGCFVVSLDELVELLSRPDDHLFVDRCQVLGCRMVVGGSRVAQQLEQRVLGPLIFRKAEEFAARVEQEVVERRRVHRPLLEGQVDIKRSPGGLREIYLALALAKARLATWNPGDGDPFGALQRMDPARAPIYEGLSSANEFLVAVRTAYRVTVAASDQIEREHLEAPTRILDYPGAGRSGAPGDELFQDIEGALAAARQHIDRLLDPPTWA